MIETRVDLLRHGEAEGGAYYRGSTDDALSARGWMQLHEAVGDGCPWTRVVSSPLKRCEQFARAFALDHALPLDIEARWREFHFGAWEGKTSAEIHAANPEHLTQFWNDPVRFPPPQGESFVAFRTRVLAAWNTLLIRYPGEHILVVTHGGPIRIILGLGRDVSWPDLLGLPVPLASLHTVRIAAAHVSSRCEPLTIPTC